MNISKRVCNLVKKYNTHDPLKIAKYRGIDISYYDLGSIKGIYKKILTNKFIGLNENLDELSELIVISHELGHDIIHGSKQIQLMKDSFLFPKSSAIELQANKFAAELLIYEGANYDYLINNKTNEHIVKELIQLKNSDIR